MALVKKYKARLEELLSPVNGIYTLGFASDKKFRYKPGQFLHLALDEYDPSQQWPESRCFSIQSTPEDNLLKITYSVRGKFTKRMAEELYTGKEVWLKLPYGELFQNENSKKNNVFIAGGTGVTPFLSLFTHPSFIEYETPKLYLGFRAQKYYVFKDSIEKAKENNPSFNVNLFFEDTNGLLDISSIYNDNRNTTYYISGPPLMIKNFRKYLIDNGIEKEKIITDDWE
jgi:NAD(P)H-flavin reductase